ncbi:hypothetical protein DEM25_015740 [Oceaniradius stylonematis]|jgi:hypothetical protein|uniref:Uncharacterized protein n=2 Tax=Pseudomonadota TaxID=1224 RepID=A0A3A8AJX1_9HYPH|nr:hypothetical protein DEM25_015740 [Oceaniradius stylonematis]
MDAMPQRTRKLERRGWYRHPRHRDPDDGLFWQCRLKMGRVHRGPTGWVWTSYCGDRAWGLKASKEEAKREVEKRADLGRITAQCWPKG